jgi:hypothetical protein
MFQKYQKYVQVCSCRVYADTSEICASIWLCSTRWNIRNICQYIVVQYTMKQQKIRYWHIFLMFLHLLYNYILAHILLFHRVLYNYILADISNISSCTAQLDTGTYFWCFVVYCRKHRNRDLIWFDLLCLTPFSALFQLYHDVGFSGGISRSAQRESPTSTWRNIRNMCQYLDVK